MLNNLWDTLSDLLYQEFSSISIGQLMLALGVAFLLSLYVVLIYRLVYSGVLFSKRFALSLVLLTMITCIVILTISTNVVLSLGMVGALSIVRFRTAVKDVMDTVFMFWAIAVGIITGAGFAMIAAIATLAIGLLLLVLFRLSKHINIGTYLVVFRLSPAADSGALLKSLPTHRVRSRNITDDKQDLVLEMKLNNAQTQRVQQLIQNPDVLEVNIVSYNAQSAL
ncbi:MAG: DUF4956 domain-containing protein [Clostridia bacterium]|nr:DUF4956 domain-containing protein [Clostridia bacterium]